jgi:hypothetical protein
MYDGINVASIPNDATEILAYTDGAFANVDKAKQSFPNAKIHTISAVGKVVAEWIDCETGCVWPPEAAVSLYIAWRDKGCKGFYSALSTQQAIREQCGLHGIDPHQVGWFDAHYTDVPTVDAGNEATQFLNTPGYDETVTTPAFEGEPAVPPAPVHTPPGGNMLAFDPLTGGTVALRPDGSTYADGGAPYLGGLNTHPDYQAGAGKANGPAVGIAFFGPAGSGGYEILCDNGTSPEPARYRFPRDGSLAA